MGRNEKRTRSAFRVSFEQVSPSSGSNQDAQTLPPTQLKTDAETMLSWQAKTTARKAQGARRKPMAMREEGKIQQRKKGRCKTRPPRSVSASEKPQLPALRRSHAPEVRRSGGGGAKECGWRGGLRRDEEQQKTRRYRTMKREREESKRGARVPLPKRLHLPICESGTIRERERHRGETLSGLARLPLPSGCLVSSFGERLRQTIAKGFVEDSQLLIARRTIESTA